LTRPIVVIESPFAGDVWRNVNYARAAMRDCIRRGETPYASHLLYTQQGILDDEKPDQRALGIEMGFQFWNHAARVIFYTDLGWSRGMTAAKARLETEHVYREAFGGEMRKLPLSDVLDVQERSIPGWLDDWERRAGVARRGETG
jgi:hypothetical protein